MFSAFVAFNPSLLEGLRVRENLRILLPHTGPLAKEHYQMSIIQHDNKTHERTCNLAEMTRQVAVSAAIAAGGGSATVQKAIQTAEATYYRALIASCIANGVPGEATFRQSLHDLIGQSTC